MPLWHGTWISKTADDRRGLCKDRVVHSAAPELLPSHQAACAVWPLWSQFRVNFGGQECWGETLKKLLVQKYTSNYPRERTCEADFMGLGHLGAAFELVL